MIQAKSVFVRGQYGTIHGQKETTLAKEVDKVINQLLQESGGKLDSLNISALGGAFQDAVLVTVLCEVEAQDKNKKK